MPKPKLPSATNHHRFSVRQAVPHCLADFFATTFFLREGIRFLFTLPPQISILEIIPLRTQRKIDDEVKKMALLIQNIHVYNPDDMGIQDILICNDKIIAIAPHLDVKLPDLEILDGTGKIAAPGFIDQHVHITGGGGESGFASRVPEIQLSDIIRSGVTTVVGLLGTDSRTRSVENLAAKAKALNEEGITAYFLTGAYEYPSVNITGNPGNDILFINECIGIKLAISDHRCSSPDKKAIIDLATQARLAGLISKKPGYVHFHTGIGKDGLNKLIEIIKETDIPVQHFRPTHIRPSTPGAVEFASLGGRLDFTTGGGPEGCADRIEGYLDSVPFEQMTCSSDSNGSMPRWNEKKEIIGLTASKMSTLYETIQVLLKRGWKPEKALRLITRNVAEGMDVYPKKGALAANSDADVTILDENWEIDSVIARGKVMMKQKQLLAKGFFEE
jgi:beta-aspartyl-dipeptidase (metallo-type)